MERDRRNLKKHVKTAGSLTWFFIILFYNLLILIQTFRKLFSIIRVTNTGSKQKDKIFKLGRSGNKISAIPGGKFPLIIYSLNRDLKRENQLSLVEGGVTEACKGSTRTQPRNPVSLWTTGAEEFRSGKGLFEYNVRRYRRANPPEFTRPRLPFRPLSLCLSHSLLFPFPFSFLLFVPLNV